ncbi:MAG: glycosyltransferase family 2 protein [Candidatus Omnitrophica bacterium]|nr:glycosyltransferase family 2 protein [Candidatus Omnitrophota bacterium]
MTSSVVIPTKDRPADIQKCVGSIIVQTVLPDELIIVDSSSTGISSENQINCENIVGDKIGLIYLRSSPGVNKQRNLGAEKASGEIILFLDDDVVLHADYIEKILEVYKLKDDAKLGGVQGSLFNYYNPNWINGVFKKFFFMTRASKNEKGRFLPSLGYVYILEPKGIIEVEAMPAGLCSFYKKVFNKFKFDEDFDRCTDLEISYRVSRNYKLYQTPFALLTHNHSESTHLPARDFNRKMLINAYNLHRKHTPGKLKNHIAYCWSVVGEVILNTIKSIKALDARPILGILDGIRHIMQMNKEG